MNLNDAIAIQEMIESQDRSLDDQYAIADAIQILCAQWKSAMTGVEMEGQLGAPDWRGFELRTWQLGESLRVFLKRKKEWRGKGPLLDRVEALLVDAELGKGRQTLALLLGEFGGKDYAKALGRALQEPEVRGHAIKALTKAKVQGFEGEVAAIQTQETGWVRNAARRYLQQAGW